MKPPAMIAYFKSFAPGIGITAISTAALLTSSMDARSASSMLPS
jgi:hypothetical protein